MGTLACERARLWAALSPDGDLTELEERALAVHLDRCPACREFAGAVVAIADVLRASPPEPVPAVFAVPVRSRRRKLFRASELGAAAAAVAVAVSIGSTTLSGREPRTPAGLSSPLAASVQAGADATTSAFLGARPYDTSGLAVLRP